MGSLLDTPGRALLAGVGVTVVILLLWTVVAGADPVGFVSYLLRFVHVYASMIWIGLIFFVNFAQLVAVGETGPEGRSALMKSVAPRVASGMRHTSHLTVLSGVLLLVTSGYLLDRTIFTAEVYIPPLRNLLLWGGTLGGIVMWVFLNFIIWPNLKKVIGLTPADDAQKDLARGKVKTYARLNLVLGLPVTAVMVAAAHLY